jgi:hypothetical protein
MTARWASHWAQPSPWLQQRLGWTRPTTVAPQVLPHETVMTFGSPGDGPGQFRGSFSYNASPTPTRQCAPGLTGRAIASPGEALVQEMAGKEQRGHAQQVRPHEEEPAGGVGGDLPSGGLRRQ